MLLALSRGRHEPCVMARDTDNTRKKKLPDIGPAHQPLRVV